MKVENFTNRNGNAIPNQFIITDGANSDTYFQSYKSIIVKRESCLSGKDQIYLDKRCWDYSVTTGKYRNLFLGEDRKETEKKIKSGEYILTDLN